MSTTSYFKPGDHGWFWGHRWKVLAVRPDPRCDYVVDLEREQIPAGTVMIIADGKQIGEPVDAPPIMALRMNIPQFAVASDVFGMQAIEPDPKYIANWLGWPEDFKHVEAQKAEVPASPTEVVSPLGPRQGAGSFETFFDAERFATIDLAISAQKAVVVDFIKDANGIIWFEAWHIKDPSTKKRRRLEVQHFPFGVDVFDDEAAVNLAQEFTL